MDSSPAAVETEGPDEPTVEARIEAWVRIVSSLVALVWLLDEATHGEISTQIAYRVRQLRARWRREAEIRKEARRVIFDATVTVEEAGQ